MRIPGPARVTLLILGALLLAAAPVRLGAQEAVGAGSPPSSAHGMAQPPAATAKPPAKPTLADLAWLAGRWQGNWGSRVAQQVWTAPRAGLMLGTFQLAEGDKTLVLELFTFSEGASGVKFYLRHFTPTLAAWETPGPTTLDLESADAKAIVFVNTVDGQPKKSTLTRVDADTYISRAEIVPEKGDPQITEITYHRISDGPPPKQHNHKQKK